MKIVTNPKLIKRNSKIGQYTAIGSLVIFGLGLYFSFNPDNFTYSLIALVIGVLVSQISIYYGNRWGRSPRPDEKLTAGLKGLDDKYSLYHYTTPVPHVLVGPAGVWILHPYYQSGEIVFEKGRWKQKRVNFLMRMFAQESLGRPDLDVKSVSKDLVRELTRALPEENSLPIQNVLVFVNPKVTLEGEESPVPAITIDKLKDFIRRKAKEAPLSLDKVDRIRGVFPEGEPE